MDEDAIVLQGKIEQLEQDKMQLSAACDELARELAEARQELRRLQKERAVSESVTRERDDAIRELGKAIDWRDELQRLRDGVRRISDFAAFHRAGHEITRQLDALLREEPGDG